MTEISQRQYEFIFIIFPDIEEKAIDAFEQETKKKIEGLGGNFVKRESLEKRGLAYPIKKNQFGYYLIIRFTLDPAKLKELLALFKHEQKLLRYMINFIEEPSVKSVRVKDKIKPAAPQLRGAAEGEPSQGLEPRLEDSGREKIKKAEPKLETLKKEIVKASTPEKVEKKKESKTQLEDIDKKLDEILGDIS